MEGMVERVNRNPVCWSSKVEQEGSRFASGTDGWREDVADVLGEPIDRDGLDQGVRLRVVAVAADPGKGEPPKKSRLIVELA
jgi:hypothetical protein